MTITAVQERVKEAKFGTFHLQLGLICLMLITFDGYDVAVFGTISPSLMSDWNIPAVDVGVISSVGLFGMLVGAASLGNIADRLGRKPAIVLAVVLYSGFTTACGFAHEPVLFSIFRFLAGVGLGGIMPNVIAILTDFAPRKYSASMTTVVLCGFALGGLLAPLLGMWVIPLVGWRVSMWIAVVPLVLLPWILRAVPESLVILGRRGNSTEIARTLLRVSQEQGLTNFSLELAPVASAKRPSPVAGLFKQGRASSTLLFWLAFFAHLLLAYGILSWLPKLMMESGFSLVSSLFFSVVFQIGGVVGTLAGGRLVDKFGAKGVIIGYYVLGAVVLVVLGISNQALLSYVLIGVAGATITGVQNMVQVFIANFYPGEMRGTALGAASSVGRAGAICGPIIGGVMLTAGMPTQAIFFAFAAPAIVATLAIALVRPRVAAEGVGSGSENSLPDAGAGSGVNPASAVKA